MLYVWVSTDTGWVYTRRLGGMDGKPPESRLQAGGKIEGKLESFPETSYPTDLKGSWPAFRGPDYDGISNESYPLASSWPGDGPEVLWSLDVGEGYAGPAIYDGRVYLVDYDRENQADVIRCLSLYDGADIWKYSYPIKIKRFHGMSRTVPAVTDKYVVAIGPKCHLTCLDSQTGQFKWMYNMVSEFGSKVPLWYTGQCPIIEDGRAIVAPAGRDVLVMAVDCETGEIAWKAPNPDGWVMTHSSVVPMEFEGRKFYVYCGGDDSNGGIVAVSADDGSVLWKTDQWKVRTNVPAPVVIEPDRLFVSAGYGQYDKGCAMIQLKMQDDKIVPEFLYEYDTEVFSSMQQTPIYYKGYIYGVRMVDKQMLCMDLDANVVWSSTSAVKFGHGPYTIADGKIFAMDDHGLLRMLQATHTGYNQLAEAQVIPDGHDSWGPMAIVSGRLIVRDMFRMFCLDVSGD